MIKWGKQFPVLIALAAVLILSAMALSDVDNPRDIEKAQRAQELLSKQSISASQPADPAVVEKRQHENDLAERIAAEEAVGMDKASDPVRPVKPVPAMDRDQNPGPASIAAPPVTYEPRTVYLQEDFEADIFPPTNWDTINTNPDYGWFLGSYSSGTQAALVTWDQTPPAEQQDEWLITPEMDFSGAGSLLRMEFEFLQGYSYPHDFNIYYSLDGTNFTQFWNSDSTGYPAFEWFATTVDLSSLIGESSVWIAFQYYGLDADLFGVDNIVVTDDAPPVGRCCYGDPTAPDCADVTQAECTALGGSWTEGTDCATDPCPVAGDNDICSNVTPQSLPYTFTGTTVGSTFDTECQYFGDYPNVWIAFTITECSDVTISYCNTAAGWGNGWLNLITDCSCAEGTLVSGAEYDFNCANGNANIYFSRLDAGTYYYPVMDDPANGASGDYVIDITAEPCPPAPENDDCASAEEIGNVTDYAFNTEAATLDGTGYSGGPNIWYAYTATCDGEVTVSLCGSSYDTKVAAYEGLTCDPLGPMVASNDDYCGLQSEISFLATTGDVFLIEVGGYGSSSAGDGLLTITCEEVVIQPGDNCENPIKVDIPALPWSDIGQTTCDRGNSYEDPDDDICMGYYTSGEDIFYEITVLQAVTVNFHLDPKGTSYSGMGLFSSCPPTLDNCIDHETGYSSSPKSMTCVSLEPGVYYLMIDTWASPVCIPEFDLTIVDTTCVALENDNCADAIEVGEVTGLAFSTDAATFDGPGGCLTSPNIWYAYTATADGKAIISLCNSSYDTKLAVYEGTCGSLVELACNDDACGLQSEIELSGVTAGSTYYVEVGGYGSNTGDGVLDIYLTEDCEYTCTGGTPEGEDCIPDDGDDVTNGGCNSDPPAFGSISCGETVCGEANTYLFGTDNYRDTDWYEFVLDEWTQVTFDAVGRLPLIMGLLEQVVPGQPGCDNLTGYISPYMAADPCSTATVTAVLSPGTYYVFVAPGEYTGFPCNGDTYEYGLTMACTPADPVLCSGSGGCDEYISRVAFADIDNSSTCDGYMDYTDIVANVEVGESYPITIENGNPYSSDQCGVWIDWNNDYVLSPDEAVTLDVSVGNGPYTGTVTVPADAVEGNHIMRVRITYNKTPEPCGADSYGEVEDYTVFVDAGAPPFMMYPEMFHVAAKYSVPSVTGYCIMSNAMMGEGQAIIDIENMAMSLDGCPVAITEIDTLDFYDAMAGPVLRIGFPLTDFIVCEETRQGGLIYDVVESFFDVTYELEGVPGTMTMQVPIRGHRSGDLNFDEEVNVSDLAALVDYLFLGEELIQPEIGNVNGDDMPEPNVSDLSYFVDFLFRGGPALQQP